jgi:hypothetical protein
MPIHWSTASTEGPTSTLGMPPKVSEEGFQAVESRPLIEDL